MRERFGNIGDRYGKIVGFIVILMLILAIRLFVVTVIQNDKWSKDAVEQNTRTIYTPAPRGNIYDRKGNVLATSKPVFTATFLSAGLNNKDINSAALRLMKKMEENKDKFVDNFPIKKDDKGNFFYTYDKEKEKWLSDHGFSKKATPEDVLNHYIAEYSLDKKLDRFEALDKLQNDYQLYVPIAPKKMIFVYDNDKKNFWKKFNFSDDEVEKGISPKDCFNKLIKKYEISKSLSFDDSRKILIVRNELASNGYTRYMPVTIGTSLSQDTVVYLEEKGIPGVVVVADSQRYYPNNEMAAHVIGYMGSISESEAAYYVKKKGYMPTDLVGKAGIEAIMEDKLHGKPGMKKIRVNSFGQYVETVSDTPAKKGKDIYLTLDSNIQKVSDASLKKMITEEHHGTSGAVVVLDAKTSEVLAMTSYPSFDLNMFSDGISTAEWDSIQPSNPRDSLSPSPLFNYATKAAVPPGSIFKPITALAALECGLNPNMQILDKGHIDLGGRSFGCSLWNEYHQTHGMENLYKAMGFSCNYYFYCIATNKNWGNGQPIHLREKMSVDKILDTAKSLGLGEPTGIELDEVTTSLPSKEKKMQNFKISLWNALFDKSRTFFPKSVYENRKKLTANIDKIVGWMSENPSYTKLLDRLEKETDIKKSKISEAADMIKFDYFNLATWTTADVFNICIGQGDNLYTPVEMASYLATLDRNGERKPVSVVYGVEGQGKTVKSEIKSSKISEENKKTVLRAMEEVVNIGSLNQYLKGYPVKIAAKTGTAEYQAIKQPKDEVEFIKSHLSTLNAKGKANVSWSKVESQMKELMLKNPKDYPTENDAVDRALILASDYKITLPMINNEKDTYNNFGWVIATAPADDPQIVVAVMLVEGGYGYYAGSIVKDIMDEYFQLNAKQKSAANSGGNKEKSDDKKIDTPPQGVGNNIGTNVIR